MTAEEIIASRNRKRRFCSYQCRLVRSETMDAVKFFKTVNRLCKNQGCNVCPVGKEGRCMVGFDDNSVKNIEETVLKVEQWAKNYHVKTRQSKFLKMFPDAQIDTYGALTIRPCSIKKDLCSKCTTLSDCVDCRREYWLTEVTDID